MSKVLGIACVFAVALAACGSNAAKSSAAADGNTNSGTVTGGDTNALFVIAPIDNNVILAPPPGAQAANFMVLDTMTFQYPVFEGIAGINATIVINSTANGCGDANVNGFHVGETQVVINITDIPDTVIAPNTYVFPATAADPYEISSATFAKVEAPCTYNSVSLVSGQVVVSDVQPGYLSGSYNLTFTTGTISGVFTTAPGCPAVGTTPATAPTCN